MIGPERLIGLPLLLEHRGDDSGPIWIALTEANLTDHAGMYVSGVDGEPGTLTATLKDYIDFCAEQGIAYHSLDGLDIAWYGGPINPDGPTDVTTAAALQVSMPPFGGFAARLVRTVQ